ncbi:MAG TPA: 16S rRNA (cytosine(1402)-N(4))-methyltransferase RsmH [Thermomicrobiales bacterium]|nr:16S rRNA (cytosine(1402)-N(4))-methyltransferase RsmH [Thermomicrobiales bacterium]
MLLAEVITALQPRPDGRYLDGTFGGGGHTRALLDASAPGGVVLALDADPDAIARAELLAADPAYRDRMIPVRANFAALASKAEAFRLAPLDGILLDLGLSSFQLEDADRGFAIRLDGPLDMRFDPDAGISAADLVNTLPESELAAILFRFGEERRARRIAAAIVRERATNPIASTTHLAKVIERAAGGRGGAHTHPATRSFQALRIAVNDELAVLERALGDAVATLAPGGRVAVISFHSLEDRIVKRFIASQTTTCTCPPDQPICTCDTIPRLRKVGGAIRPSVDEVANNPRSRSATLRVAERLDDASSGGRP